MSMRTGSAPAGAVLTTTVASHSPAGEVCAADCDATLTSAATANTADSDTIRLVISCSRKTKGPGWRDASRALVGW